jgi:hypothetical protein
MKFKVITVSVHGQFRKNLFQTREEAVSFAQRCLQKVDIRLVWALDGPHTMEVSV